ncbi:hypothetical protein [Alcanivorax sp.]|uniref:hypothetical protein n=1 Tax=Alcanivorax sp. TaxID=1872427 RepID=UPI000C10F5C1|nr:hypothetical protein [Alcanivorax sp.]PHR67021.1 MAG: hypothetical protein COA55_08680 [Alcanivorax sp.]
MKKVILTGLTAVALSANAMASNVEEGEVTQFNPNTQAVASEVNNNFAALIAAINDNNDRISALEEAAGEVAELADIVSGSTYKLYFSGGIIELDEGGGANLERNGGIITMTFNSNETLNDTRIEHGRFISLDEICDPDGSNCSHYVDTWSDDETGDGSWSISGQTLTVTFGDGESESFTVSLDGNVIASGGGSLDVGGGTNGVDSFVAVGIRLAD